MENEEDPFALFAIWFAAAKAGEPNDPDAMTLATATPEGRPSARMVLLKGFGPTGFVFYTNLQSRKGEELRANHCRRPTVPLEVAAPPDPHRGHMSARSPTAEADAYFASRHRCLAPRRRRLGPVACVWSPAQSWKRRVAELERRYPAGDIPRPVHWSGFRVTPDLFRVLAGHAVPPA